MVANHPLLGVGACTTTSGFGGASLGVVGSCGVRAPSGVLGTFCSSVGESESGRCMREEELSDCVVAGAGIDCCCIGSTRLSVPTSRASVPRSLLSSLPLIILGGLLSRFGNEGAGLFHRRQTALDLGLMVRERRLSSEWVSGSVADNGCSVESVSSEDGPASGCSSCSSGNGGERGCGEKSVREARVAALDRRERRLMCSPAVSRSSCRDKASSLGLAIHLDTSRIDAELLGTGAASPCANTNDSETCALAPDPRLPGAPRSAGGGRRMDDPAEPALMLAGRLRELIVALWKGERAGVAARGREDEMRGVLLKGGLDIVVVAGCNACTHPAVVTQDNSELISGSILLISTTTLLLVT